MSLQVWLPLNGNLENQGLSNAAITALSTPTYSNNGKIGQCAYGAYRINYKQTNNEVSIAFWICLTASSQWADIFSFGTGLNRIENISASGSTSCIQHWYNTSGSAFITNQDLFTLTVGKWTHVTMTADGQNVRFYIDGQLVKTASQTSTVITGLFDKDYFYIGSRDGSGSIYSANLNDFRLYNHCLSAKEVKELAKGLVLHYRLAGPGRPNLLTGTGPNDSGWGINQSGGTFTKTVTNDCTTFNVTAKATLWFLYYHTLPTSVRNSLKVNTTYTYSFEAKSNTKFSLGISLLCDDGTNSMSNNKGVAILGDNQWHKYSVQLTTIANFSSLSQTNQYFYMYGGNTISTVSFRKAKLEEGSVATPWCPNSSDSLYSTLGYNNNIEYDCSGYRYNGTKSGTITWDIDSPRYTTSYNFSPHATITTNTGFPIGSNSIFTFNIWLKVPSGKTMTQYGDYFSIKGSNLRVETSSTDGLNLYWFNYPIGTLNGIPIENVQANSWYMHTLVCDGIKFYIYLNGKLKSTIALSGTAFTTNGGLTLGDPSSAVTYFNLADARVYATALSADDIAELYHSAVIVDNTGKTYAYEYFEA